LAREDLVIEVVELTKRFSTVVALNNISFSVYKGDVFGCLGPNGAGKTTVIRCILGLLEPTEGEVKIFDASFKGNISKHGCKIGSALENPGLFEELTGEENLKFYAIILKIPKRERLRRIDLLLSFVGLESKRREKVASYSQGMKKRLILARALLNDPDLLIFDEITCGLDPNQRKTFYELINYLKEEGKTIFFSSHVLSEIEKMCNRIIILHEGQIIFCDSLENLFFRFGRHVVTARFICNTQLDEIANLQFVKHKWIKDDTITMFVSIDSIYEMNMNLIQLGLLDISVNQIKLDDIYAIILELEDKTKENVRCFRENFRRR
jgi:ABC-type multidrug transport system ATPase subunit